MRAAAPLVLVAAALAACVIAPSARAHDDPASDYLLGQQVFLPFDANAPADKQQSLIAVVAAANRAGYTIRVAVIWSSGDLGPIAGLWRKPRAYARFLGDELASGYKRRLLVVMPNGFGFNWPKHNATAEYAQLANVPVRPGSAGLVDAATAAVRHLAAASGVKVAPVHIASPAKQSMRDRKIIVLGAIVAIALVTLPRVALRRRRRR